MTDITKCNDSKCGKKDRCYRWTAPFEELHQSYFLDSPRNGDECDLFWEHHPVVSKVSEITHILKDEDDI